MNFLMLTNANSEIYKELCILPSNSQIILLLCILINQKQLYYNVLPISNYSIHCMFSLQLFISIRYKATELFLPTMIPTPYHFSKDLSQQKHVKLMLIEEIHAGMHFQRITKMAFDKMLVTGNTCFIWHIYLLI